jgi:V/A-type H+/Na+-transporting ATPase subunit K
MTIRTRFIGTLLAITTVLSLGATAFLVFAPSTFAQGPAESFRLEAIAWGWGLVGAAVATGLSSLGAGIAVGKVGAAAIGALAEKPELFGRLLIFVGLAEGIAIYGLIVSILVLNRLV